MFRPKSEDLTLLDGPAGIRVVYLLDAATELEHRMLRKWLSKSRGSATTVDIVSSRRGKGGDSEAVQELIDSTEEAFVVPCRVIWMAPGGDDRRSVTWSEIFKPGDPRDPRGLRAYWIRTFRPSRVRLIAAEGALMSQVRSDYEHSPDIDGLHNYVTRRAWRVLDQAERKLRGNRYKIPRFVPEEILGRRVFRDEVLEVASEEGLDLKDAQKEAEGYLREIAATHSPYVIDIVANAIHSLYSQGYGEIRYLDEDVDRIAKIGEDRPIVFLPAHRSNLDRLSLQFMLWENDLPPNHTAGGINMNFFPVGPIIRRTGVFFIRRSFKDNDLYKTVLRNYIDFLVEKRFPLEWYLEGGRSRSGRLRPPRFGLLHYVVDSLRRGYAEDIALIPVSIAYDQIQDVPDYAREAQGKGKEDESLGWLIRAVRSLRRRYGNIYIRFGEPLSVASMLDEIPPEESSLELQKLSFEVMYRIGKVTPITPASLVSIALLAARGSARTAVELAEECQHLQHFVASRKLPVTEQLDLGDPEVVEGILEWLGEHGNVSSHEAVGRKVYWATDEQMLRLSYYRNVIVHFFLNRSIAEVALVSMADTGSREPAEVERDMLRLRDLLKFEFFFSDRDEYLEEVSADLSADVDDWRSVLANAGPMGVMARLRNPLAYWVILPILDGYQIVGDELEATDGPFDEDKFLKACLARARMYRLENRTISGESASLVLFKSALLLARNRGLLEDEASTSHQRAEFASEVRKARQSAAFGLGGVGEFD